jgi:lysine-N-methylase
MAPKLVSPPNQRFACRDCAARCCRLPWRVRLEDDEARRYLADPWVIERAGPDGAQIIARGALPMREVDRRLECVFLDGDGLCSLQKREGHGHLPRSCQAFPFAFVRDEGGALVAELSQLCPSIRDDYGDPVDRQLAVKLQQKGEVGQMSEAMVTLGGVVLSQPQYLRVARRWTELLARGGSAAAGVAWLYDWTTAFEAALLDGPERPADASIEAALARADQEVVEPLPPHAGSSPHARGLFASLLSGLCYPSRLRRPHRIGRSPWSWIEGLRSFGNKLAWLLERGTVDMLFVARPFALQRVGGVERFLSASGEGSRVGDFLRLVLQRRRIFCSEPRHLMEVVLDLSISTLVISRFARCRAAAEDRARVAPEDVKEGISVAELLLSSHAPLSDQGVLVKSLRRLLLTNRARFREVLATEA